MKRHKTSGEKNRRKHLTSFNSKFSTHQKITKKKKKSTHALSGRPKMGSDNQILLKF